MIPDVLVVGGGCAGLAAATALAERGASVELLEAHPYLGGRSYSRIDPTSGDPEDNGQHVLMGCYEEFLAFVRRTGGEGEITFQERPEVVLLEPGGGAATFRTSGLPGKLDFLVALGRLRGFPLRDVWPLRALERMPRESGEHSVEQWLDGLSQSEEARRVFWRPLTLATLNLDPAEAPADLLVAVLRRALFGGKDAARFGFAKRGLTPLIVDPALRYLAAKGCAVRTSAPVHALQLDGGRFTAAVGPGGARIRAGAAILAVPHDAAAALLPQGAAEFDAAAAEALSASSIVAIHLWLDRVVSEHAMVGLLDSPVHWVFDRGRIGAARPPGYLALVTSAADGFVATDKDTLVRLALEEVQRFFPRARGATLLRSRVLKERRATPRFRAGLAVARPPARTRVLNLALAGDWTGTGLPATLEGAALSAHRAADVVTAG